MFYKVENAIIEDGARVLEFIRVCKRGNKTTGKLSAIKDGRLCEYKYSYDELTDIATIKFVEYWT